MSKLTERIPLTQYAYIEIEADSLAELQTISKDVKESEAYGGLIYVPKEPTIHSEAPQQELGDTLETFTDNVERKCPKCSKPMAKRMAKNGPNAGNEFWGCTGYPMCKGTLS